MLNKIQQEILDAILLFPFQDIEEVRPLAFKAILKETISIKEEDFFKFIGIYDSIKQIRDILKHPYPQNRSTGSPYVGQESGYAVWEPNGHGNGIAKEPLGLLSLTAKNDEVTPPVTREDVVKYITDQINNKINKFTLQKQLHIACESGDLPAVSKLLSEKVDPNSNGDFGFKPIHKAAINGCVDLVKMLIEAGANLNSKNYFDDSPIHWAAWTGNVDALSYLISQSEPNKLNETNIKNKSPLKGAIEGLHVDMVLYLVSKGAHIGNFEPMNQLLTKAISKNRPDIIKQCLSIGVNINTNPQDEDRVLIWYKNFLDFALFVKEPNLEIIKMLLNAGADVNLKFYADETILMKFLNNHVGYWKNREYEIVKILLEFNPDLTVTNKNGNTALDIIVFKYRSHDDFERKQEINSFRIKDKILEALLKKGAITNKKEELLRRTFIIKNSSAYPILQKYLLPANNLISLTFFKQEICGAPIESSEDWNIRKTHKPDYDTLNIKGPGYGF